MTTLHWRPFYSNNQPKMQYWFSNCFILQSHAWSSGGPCVSVVSRCGGHHVSNVIRPFQHVSVVWTVYVSTFGCLLTMTLPHWLEKNRGTSSLYKEWKRQLKRKEDSGMEWKREASNIMGEHASCLVNNVRECNREMREYGIQLCFQWVKFYSANRLIL